MNKKLITAAVSVAIGGVLLVTSAFASISNAAGYEIYKSAIKNTVSATSVTGSMNVIVKDNGEKLMEIVSDIKANKDNKALSSITTIKSQADMKEIDVYKQDGKTIIKNSDSDVYNIAESISEGKGMAAKHSNVLNDSDAVNAGETIVDVLVGNLKSFVNVNSNTDGKSEVSMQLSGSQIPAAANAAAALAVKGMTKQHEIIAKQGGEKNLGLSEITGNLKITPPQLVDEIKVDSVDLKAVINKDNLIETQNAVVAVSGKDAQGNLHSLSLNVNMNISDYNGSTPDKVDLTGKQTKTIEKDKMR